MTPPTPARTRIEGIDRNSDPTLLGTVKWKIEDDKGKIHKINLPNTYYSPTSKKRLLFPQHWAQKAGDNFPIHNGTWYVTYANKIELQWDQRWYTCTVYFSPHRNLGVMRTAPSIKKYCNVCLTIEDATALQAMPAILETYTHYKSNEEET